MPQCIALYLYLTAAATNTCTHTRLETSVRMVYNSINFNMIPTGDRRAASSGAAAQRRRQANELIREFSFFMHFINANCAQLTWQKERDRDRDRERSGKLQRQCQRYKSKSSSRNCSANKYYAAGAKAAAEGKGGRGGVASCCLLLLLLCFYFVEFLNCSN